MSKSKYRIIETPSGYVAQKRLFWIFWRRIRESEYAPSSLKDGHWLVHKRRTTYVYDTVGDAREAVERDSKFPIRYRGHRICAGHRKGQIYVPTFVDMSLSTTYETFTILYCMFGSHDIEDLKRQIDEYENKRHKERHKFDKIRVVETI